jgi:hypothetical protein
MPSLRPDDPQAHFIPKTETKCDQENSENHSIGGYYPDNGYAAGNRLEEKENTYWKRAR